MTIADWLACASILITCAVTAVFFSKRSDEPSLDEIDAAVAALPPVAVVTPLPSMTNQLKLYETAKASLGKQMKLDLTVPNLYGCASSLSGVLKAAGVTGIPQDGIASTRSLCNWLAASVDQFEEVTEAQPGDIVMSASPAVIMTGQLPNGHCGILGFVDKGVMSNDSDTGKWMEKWNLPDWLAYYSTYGGLPTRYFRRRG